jgi:hypothetical protein
MSHLREDSAENIGGVTVNGSTWEEVKQAKPGEIFHDEHKDGLRFIVMRGPMHLCAYVGLPSGHPLAGHSYDDLPIHVHGGLTFGREGDGKQWPGGFFWYGWDYGHAGDYATTYDDAGWTTLASSNYRKWTTPDVIQDSWPALYDFAQLVKLSESIVSRKYRICQA